MITLLVLFIALLIISIPVCILVLIGCISWKVLVVLLVLFLIDFITFKLLFGRKKKEEKGS